MNRKSGIEYGSRLGEKSEVRNRKPPKQTRGVADIEAGFGDVLGNDCASADDCSVTDRDREHRSIRSNAHTIAKLCGSPQVPFLSRAAGIKAIIDKHRPVRNEAIIPDRDQIADKRVRLNPASLADGCSVLYLNEWSNEAAIPNRATVEIDRLYDGHILTELNVNYSSLPDLRLC